MALQKICLASASPVQSLRVKCIWWEIIVLNFKYSTVYPQQCKRRGGEWRDMGWVCCSRPNFPNSWCPVFVCSSLGYTSTMLLLINSANCQIVGFVVTTIGWIRTTSMGFVGVASMVSIDNASHPLWSGLHGNVESLCLPSNQHHHSYLMSQLQLPWYLPTLDIRVSQNLLLDVQHSRTLGKASVIFALKNVSMGILETTTTYKAFVISGILNIAAGICISVAVTWNYHSVMTEEGIVFPPSFNIPFKSHMLRKLATLLQWHV